MATFVSFFGIQKSATISINLTNEDQRKQIEVKSSDKKKQKLRYPLFFDGESVCGKTVIQLKDKKPLEHLGIKVEFIGNIELFYDRGKHYEFLSMQQELSEPGTLTQNSVFEFKFKNVEKLYESYHGINVKLRFTKITPRYFVRVTVTRRVGTITKEKEIWVYSYRIPEDINNAIKMEVGIEDCLHIEFEYNKSRYNLKDVIVGKIYFLLVRIKIKYMELCIIRRETTGTEPNIYNESETITKYEIMDGAPVKGETIPIRLFMGGFELTPTYREVNKKFSIRYYLNLVLIDEENRRYFKQQEITLYRKEAHDHSNKGTDVQASLESEKGAIQENNMSDALGLDTNQNNVEIEQTQSSLINNQNID